MRRGLEDAHWATAQEVRGSNPTAADSFSLGTDEKIRVGWKNQSGSVVFRPKSEDKNDVARTQRPKWSKIVVSMFVIEIVE